MYAPAVDASPDAIVLERFGFEPISVARWSEGSSSVDIVRLTPQLAVIASRGPGHPNSRSFYAEHAPTTCGREGSVIFWDLGGLTSTDLGVVSTCVGVGKAQRHNIARVHMYYDSPMVGMAITVANVALRGLIEFYRGPEPFVAAFTEASAGLVAAGQGASRPAPPAR